MGNPVPKIAHQSKIAPVRVSDLRQWAYCGRVVWWTHVCPVVKLESFKMRKGQEKEARLQELQRRRTLHAFGLGEGNIVTNLNLESPGLGLSGKLDMVIQQRRRWYPVEIKYTHGPVGLHHRIQLAAYALLLEDCYGIESPFGYVFRLPIEEVERIPMDEGLRGRTLTALRSIRRMLYDEQMPPAAVNSEQCRDCEYRNYCGDVLVDPICWEQLPTLLRG